MSDDELELSINQLIQTIHSDWLVNDMPVIRYLHPDAVAIVPLYRSALVVLPQTAQDIEQGSCVVRVYHDPGWMGESTTPESLERHCATLTFYGQRNGPECYYGAPPCHDGGITFHNVFTPNPPKESPDAH